MQIDPELTRKPRRELLLLSACLAMGVIMVALTSIAGLYRAAIEEEESALAELAFSQALFINSLALSEFGESSQSGSHTQPGWLYDQIEAANEGMRGFSKTGEILIARDVGTHIEYLTGFDQQSIVLPPSEASIDSLLLDALAGGKGSGVFTDHDGHKVLVAYCPIEQASLGLLAKKDISEIQNPYLLAGAAAILLIVSVTILVIFIVKRIGKPIFKAIESSEQRYRLIFEAASDGLILASDVYLDCNAKAYELFKANKEELVGTPLGLMSPEFQADGERSVVKARKIIERTLSGQPQHFNWCSRRVDGGSFDSEIRTTMVEIGQQRLTLLSIRDVTSELEVERELEASRARLAEIYRGSSMAIFVIDPGSDKIIEANPAAAAMLGYDMDELIGMPASHVHPNEMEKFQWYLQSVQEQGNLFTDELTCLTKKGVRLAAEISGSRLDTNGNEFILAMVRDVSAEHEIRARMIRLSSVVEFSGSALLTLDVDGKVEYANPRFSSLTGFSETEIKGKLLAPTIFSEAEAQTFTQAFHSALKGREIRQEICLRNKKMAGVWTIVTLSAVLDSQQQTVCCVCVFEDIDALKHSQSKLEQLSLYDNLTELANRQLFFDRLQLALKQRRSRRLRGYVGVLHIDLDGFKRINDSLGSESGDKVLREAGRRIQSVVRNDDTVARLSADEFAVVLTDFDTPERAAKIAGKVLDKISEPLADIEESLVLGASIGISLTQDGRIDAGPLASHADIACERSKQRLGSYFSFYVEEMEQVARQRLQLEQELRVAISENQFVLHYQPKLDTTKRKLAGYEALIRWKHPRLGLVMPDDFIPIAEESKLIWELGSWVLREACRKITKLQEGSANALTVAVNLSAVQFQDYGIVDDIRQALEETGAEARRLEVEITESTFIHDFDAAVQQLMELKSMGVSISVDDFGVGYSSLNYIRQLPIDWLKIDRSFVLNIPDNQLDCRIAAVIIAMAKELGIGLIAEGIENEQQFDYFRKAGCQLVQGYLLGGPAILD